MDLVNNDLVNIIGNLLNCILLMVCKWFDDVVFLVGVVLSVDYFLVFKVVEIVSMVIEVML